MTKLNQKAQNLLEYTIVLVLVIAGIIIGAPYVIRSWNAQIMSLEESVVSSFEEPLLNAPDNAITIDPCICSDWSNGGCGNSSCNWLGNSTYIRYEFRECNTNAEDCPDIEETERCIPDGGCCTYHVPALPAQCGVNSGPCENGNPCAEGEYCLTEICNANQYRTENKYCVIPGLEPYPVDCDLPNSCDGLPPTEGICSWNCINGSDDIGDETLMLLCGARETPGDPTDDDDYGLTSDVDISYVPFGGCTPERKCEYECQNGNYPVNNTCGICPVGTVLVYPEEEDGSCNEINDECCPYDPNLSPWNCNSGIGLCSDFQCYMEDGL